MKVILPMRFKNLWFLNRAVRFLRTSLPCGKCGKLNDVGGREIYICKFCNYKIDRDILGSRNILLKNLTQRLGVSEKSRSFRIFLDKK